MSAPQFDLQLEPQQFDLQPEVQPQPVPSSHQQPNKSAATPGSEPSLIDSIGGGMAKSAGMGFGDEVMAVAKMLGIEPKNLSDALISLNPLGISPEKVAEAYKKYNPLIAGTKGADQFVSDYRDSRAATKADYARKQKAHPIGFGGGRIVSGIASSIGMGAPESLAGAILGNGALGAVGGLGESEADLTKGEVGQAIKDAGVGGLVGGAAGAIGYGATKAIEGAKRFAASMGESKTVGALSKFLKNITERNGPPEAQKQIAGKLMDAAREAAGDTPLGLDNFLATADDLVAKSTSPGAGGLSPEMKMLADAADEIRGNGGTLTLKDIDNNLQVWSERIRDWANDPAKQRVAKLAAKALGKDLDAASGNSALGQAAQILSEARTAYGKGARAADLQDILLKAEDNTSLDKFISPRKFAVLNSGKNAKGVARLLAGDPEAAAAWQAGVDASKVLAKKGDSWAPKFVQDALPKKMLAGLQRAMTYRNVTKVFTDPELARDFVQLVSPNMTTGREAIAIASRLIARLADEESPAMMRAADNSNRDRIASSQQ